MCCFQCCMRWARARSSPQYQNTAVRRRLAALQQGVKAHSCTACPSWRPVPLHTAPASGRSARSLRMRWAPLRMRPAGGAIKQAEVLRHDVPPGGSLSRAGEDAREGGGHARGRRRRQAHLRVKAKQPTSARQSSSGDAEAAEEIVSHAAHAGGQACFAHAPSAVAGGLQAAGVGRCEGGEESGHSAAAARPAAIAWACLRLGLAPAAQAVALVKHQPPKPLGNAPGG